VFQRGDRIKLIPKISLIWQNVVKFSTSSSLMLRKLCIKLIQRIGLTFLPPRVPKWRYQPQSRSLFGHLPQSTSITSSQTLSTVSKTQYFISFTCLLFVTNHLNYYLIFLNCDEVSETNSSHFCYCRLLKLRIRMTHSMYRKKLKKSLKFY
jgi:hypothetical protein